MTGNGKCRTVAALILGASWLVALDGPPARGQAIGFQPGITPVPDGAILDVLPVVTADRRYVRLGLTPQFYGLRGVNSFSFPAGAVAGGGFGGGQGGGNPGGGFFAAQLGPNNNGPAIVPRQVGINNNPNVGRGAAVIPGLAAVGSSWWGVAPGYGYQDFGFGYPPAYGYGYGYPYPAYGTGFGPFAPGFGYNPFNDPYVQPVALPQGVMFIPRNPTVNNLGGVMQAIMGTVGRR